MYWWNQISFQTQMFLLQVLMLHQYCPIIIIEKQPFQKMKRARNDSGGQMCRDFEKGTCFRWLQNCMQDYFPSIWNNHEFFNVNQFNLRGERCKFKHPADKKEGDEKIPFCNDFRQVVLVCWTYFDNSGHIILFWSIIIQGTCKYRECIYVHAPKVLEQEYLQTGEYQPIN